MSSVSWDGAGAYAFVVDHSPEGGEGDDGLLPGLCAFAEQWMVQVGANNSFLHTFYLSTLFLFRPPSLSSPTLPSRQRPPPSAATLTTARSKLSSRSMTNQRPCRSPRRRRQGGELDPGLSGSPLI